jgi:hypothetical protein
MPLARVHQTEHRVVSNAVADARVHQTEHRVVSNAVADARVHQLEFRVVSSMEDVPAVSGLPQPVICICM